MNDFILINRKILKYIIFDLIINVLLKQNRKTILFKKKFVDVFKYIFVVMQN